MKSRSWDELTQRQVQLPGEERGGVLNPGLNESSTQLYFSTATSAVAAVAQVAVPLALAASIFCEGLLDIDLVLNRTITCGALTAILVGFVLLSSIVQRILVTATGGSSDIALLTRWDTPTFSVAFPVGIRTARRTCI